MYKPPFASDFFIVISKIYDFLSRLNSEDKLFYILITSILTISGSLIIANRNFKLQKKKELVITIADIISKTRKAINSFRLLNFYAAQHSVCHNLSHFSNGDLYRQRSENSLNKSNEVLELFENHRAELDKLIIVHRVNSPKNDNKYFFKEQMEKINLMTGIDFSNDYNDISDIDDLEKKYISLSENVQIRVQEQDGIKALMEICSHFAKALKINYN